MTGEFDLSNAIDAFKRGDLDRALALAEGSASNPPSPAWHHLIGLIHCRRGNPDRGVEFLRLATEAEPANASFRLMLARALIDSGRAADVLNMAKPQPTSAELPLWQARTEAAAATGQSEAAAEAWNVIATLNKADPDAWINLSRSYFALARFDEAIDACWKALALAPRDIEGFLTLGLIYERTNRLDELGRLLDESLRCGIDKTQLSYLWALRDQRAGRLESAREFLLKSDPAEDPVRWHRLRLKIADKEGDAAAAFDAMVSMNRATPNFDKWVKRGTAFRRDLRALADAMTPAWAARIPQLGPVPGRPPVFLIGLPRSGTTLLDTFLMGHRSIDVIEEKEMLRRAGRNVEPLSKLPDHQAITLERARQDYLDELGSYADPATRGIVIDKNPFNMLLAPLIAALFPGAPIIFAKRHPCDAVLSGFMQSYIPNVGMASFLRLTDAADMYDACMREWAASTELFPLNVRSVAYEDLISDPARELCAVVDFLGLDWDERMMDHRTTAKERGALTNTSYDQITEPLTAGAVGRWQRYERQLEPVLPVLLPWARWLGY